MSLNFVEEQIVFTHPLKDAFAAFNGKKHNANKAIDSGDSILTNKFPKALQNAYVTGLQGYYILPEKITVGQGDNAQTFPSNTRLFWRIRWEFDQENGPHVNAQFGSHPSSKFAYLLDSTKIVVNQKATMNSIARGLNRATSYQANDSVGKDIPIWEFGEEKALEDLKDYFKASIQENA